MANHEVFFVFVISSLLFSGSYSQNEMISHGMKNIFLSKIFNSNESEWILKSARESYSLLKTVENHSDVSEKLNFVNGYSNFLMKLYKDLQSNETDIQQIFSDENNFLKEFNFKQTSEQSDVNKLQAAIDDIQIAAERHLVSHYNTSNASFNALELLTINDTSFDIFVKGKLRADYSEIGYFFLEIFATLIGLSWGIISTVLHVARPMTEQ